MKSTWSGVKAAMKQAAEAVAVAVSAHKCGFGCDCARRADVNARGDALRAEREAALFGSSRWLARRSNWLGRGR